MKRNPKKKQKEWGVMLISVIKGFGKSYESLRSKAKNIGEVTPNFSDWTASGEGLGIGEGGVMKEEELNEEGGKLNYTGFL